MNSEDLKANLKGTIIPVTTPFKRNYKVNYEALESIMAFYLEKGIKSFIAAGSTGQCYTLKESEHKNIVETIVNVCSDYENTFVLAGCSHTSTSVSNKLADICQEAGADSLLLTPPYYRPSREMCIEHYLDVGKKHDIPLIIYHDQLMPEDINLWDKFVEESNILGVKFATWNIRLAMQIIVRYRNRLSVYGGGGMLLYLPMALHGSIGYVASFASFIPEIENKFIELLNAGRIKDASKIAELEIDLFNFREQENLYWFNLLVGLINAVGLPGGYCRKPLVCLKDLDMQKVRKFLDQIKLKYENILKEISC